MPQGELRDEGDFALGTAGGWGVGLRMAGSISMETQMGGFWNILGQSGDIVVRGR